MHRMLTVGLGAVAILVAAGLFRYEVVIGSRGNGVPPAYRLDRWTGDVKHLSPAAAASAPSLFEGVDVGEALKQLDKQK
jgi:hypothetical protein